MGTSFGTVWSPTSIIFLLIMMLFLEAGGIFPCVWEPRVSLSFLLVASGLWFLLRAAVSWLAVPSSSSGKPREPQFTGAPSLL